MINQESFDEYCVNLKNSICFLVFLPHIYDSSAQERNGYIQIMKDAQEKMKSKPIALLWAQGGDYFDIENTFNLASGYPAVVGLSMSKNKYAYLKGTYSKQSLEDFISRLLSGREPLYNIPGSINVKSSTEWDGNDKKPEVYNEDL